MRERSENFRHVTEEAETTLVAPRFDAEEARRAHPVVPLSEARSHASSWGTRASARRGLPRSWTNALIGVALLAVAALGGAVANRVFRPAQSDPSAAYAPAAEPPRLEAQSQPKEARAKLSPSTPRGERRRDVEERGGATRDADAGGGEGEAVEREEVRSVRPRVRESRRARDAENEAAREMRKVLKRAGEKAPRLVGVLTGP